MRTQEEIQRAHDLLVGIILGEVPWPTDDREDRNLFSAAACLCWVLGHDHNPRFGEFLGRLESALLKKGFSLDKFPDDARAG